MIVARQFTAAGADRDSQAETGQGLTGVVLVVQVIVEGALVAQLLATNAARICRLWRTSRCLSSSSSWSGFAVEEGGEREREKSCSNPCLSMPGIASAYLLAAAAAAAVAVAVAVLLLLVLTASAIAAVSSCSCCLHTAL